MKLIPETRETILGSSAALQAGEMSCADILKVCIARIEQQEPDIRAWAHLDLEQAEDQARKLDEELGRGERRGPLHGIPVGIKDIIDVEGLPTGCGSRRWSKRIASADAPVVSALRKAGAVILGKTVTTAYAWIDPPVTHNPWNFARTPGGSSSGSAAAVASGMCLGAIGSQTGGSIIRPAAFCGVAGLKPSYNSVGTDGVLPFAPSLDHIGPIARTVGDVALLFGTIGDAQSVSSPVGSGPTIGLFGESFWERAESPMREAFGETIQAFESAGARVIRADELFDFDRILRCHRTIMAAEAAANHRDRRRECPDDYPTRIASLVDEGSGIPAYDYVRAKRLQGGGHDLDGNEVRSMYAGLFRFLDSVDLVATPATLGAAPDLTTTGDPIFNSIWSFFGCPAVTYPIALGSDGLPLGIQLVGASDRDLELLASAAWCEEVSQGALSEKRS